jgi:hypothetical protein
MLVVVAVGSCQACPSRRFYINDRTGQTGWSTDDVDSSQQMFARPLDMVTISRLCRQRLGRENPRELLLVFSRHTRAVLQESFTDVECS